MSVTSAVPVGEQSLILLIVDFNDILARSVAASFRAEGWLVYHCGSGQQAREQLRLTYPSLIILDLNLPDMHGLQLLVEIEGNAKRPPVIVTSEHADDSLVLASIRLGAIDYVLKPFAIGELLQRAILRVKSRISSTAQPDHWGDVVIDDARRILYVRGTAVPLPPKTFDVLSHLIQNEGRVVLQSELIALIAHTTADLRTRRVAYHIALLRRVLHENKVSGCIRTIRSRGYEWMRIT